MAPNIVLTSGITKVSVMLVEATTLAQQGRWEGKQYSFGLQEGAVELAPFYGLLTAEEEAKVEAVTEEIMAGKIDVTP